MTYSIPKWVFFRISNDTVYITDCKNGRFLALSDTAYDFWLEFLNNNDFEISICNLLKIYDVEEYTLKNDFIEFLALLSSYNIIIDKNEPFNDNKNEPKDSIREYNTEVSSDIFNDHSISVKLFNEFEKNHFLYNAALELTYKCNHKCVHCYAINQKNYNFKNELNTQQWKDVLDQLYELNTQTLILTGGEVFERKDFMEIFRYAIKKRFVTTIFTNGQNISDANIKEISEGYPKSVHVSIFSSNPKIHDSITGINGSYFNAVDTLKKFKKLGTPINIKAQLMSLNENELDNIIDLAETLGAEYQIGFSISPKNDGNKEPQMFSIVDKEKLSRMLSNNRLKYIKHMPKLLKRSKEERLCGAGVYGITIDPQGNYKACIAMPEKLGNIKNESIKEFWNFNIKLQNIVNLRLKDVENCENCEISSICYFCMGLSWLESGTYKTSNQTNCLITKTAFESINGGFK